MKLESKLMKDVALKLFKKTFIWPWHLEAVFIPRPMMEHTLPYCQLDPQETITSLKFEW